jgi:hypothetical protein
MQNFNYDLSVAHFFEDKKPFIANNHADMNNYHSNYEVDNILLKTEPQHQLSKSQLAHLRESPAARQRRLQRNAERMREKRAHESDEERRKRLDKNALNNRRKRMMESTHEKAIRQVRDAARQRLRRAMETNEQRESRLRKLAERMRTVRRNESPDKRKERLTKAAQRARERLQRESSHERKVRLQKGAEYARRVRKPKRKNTENSDSFEADDETSITSFSSSQTYNNQAAFSQQQMINIPNNACKVENPHIFPTQLYGNCTESPNFSMAQCSSTLPSLSLNNPIITLNIPQYHSVFAPTHHDSGLNFNRIKTECNQFKSREKLKTVENLSAKSECGSHTEMNRSSSRKSETNQRTKRLNNYKERPRKKREIETQAEKPSVLKILEPIIEMNMNA